MTVKSIPLHRKQSVYSSPANLSLAIPESVKEIQQMHGRMTEASYFQLLPADLQFTFVTHAHPSPPGSILHDTPSPVTLLLFCDI